MPARPQLHALTGLRFLAAAHVWFYHAFPAEWIAGIPGASGLLSSGTVSVSLFFVLSGFVLAYVYLPDRALVHLPMQRFAIKRVARIYPVYALSFLVAVPYPLLELHREVGLAIDTVGQWFIEVLPSALLLHAWTPADSAGINMVAWTLSVEAFFYVTFPLVASSLWFQRALRRPGRLMVGLAVLSVVPVLLVVAGVGGDEFQRFVNRFPVMRWPEFLMGVVLGAMFLRPDTRPSLGRLRDVWRRVRGHAAFVGGAGLLLLLAATDAWPTILVRAVALPAFLLLIWGLASNAGRTSQLLAGRSMRLLGDASYALYLLHVPLFLVWLTVVEHALGWHVNGVAFRATYFAVTLLASIMTFRYFEEPARRWIRDRMHRRAVSGA